jgi:hypothetical protein
VFTRLFRNRQLGAYSYVPHTNIEANHKKGLKNSSQQRRQKIDAYHRSEYVRLFASCSALEYLNPIPSPGDFTPFLSAPTTALKAQLAENAFCLY